MTPLDFMSESTDELAEFLGVSKETLAELLVDDEVLKNRIVLQYGEFKQLDQEAEKAKQRTRRLLDIASEGGGSGRPGRVSFRKLAAELDVSQAYLTRLRQGKS